MKILLSGYCDYCREEAEKKGEKYLENLPSPSIAIELNENGVYSFKCPNNHINWTFLQEQPFQVLFDLGVLSLSDGYTREAVSSFVTSLERFYEFIIKLILLSDNIDEDLITKYWNEISKQSERQLGAYIFLFINKFKQPPAIPQNEHYQFRNDVLHRGKIPTEKETLEYGQFICDLIFDALILLKNYFGDDISKLFFNVYKYNTNIYKKKNPQIQKANGGSFPNIIQLRMIKLKEFQKINIALEVEKYKYSKKPIRISYIR